MTTPNRRYATRLLIVAALVFTQFSQGVVGVGPQQNAAAPAAAASCSSSTSVTVGNDTLSSHVSTCPTPRVDRTGKVGGGSSGKHADGSSFVKVECRGVASRSYPNGVDVYNWKANGLPHGAGFLGYDEYHLEDWSASNGFIVDATWPASWHFSSWECTHYKSSSRQVEKCETRYTNHTHTSRYNHVHTSTTNHTHYNTVNHVHTYYNPDRMRMESYNHPHTSSWNHVHTSSTNHTHYSSWNHVHSSLHCWRETQYYREETKTAYHESWTKKCDVTCKTPDLGTDLENLSRTLPDPQIDHSPADAIYGAGSGSTFASFVNLPTKFFAENLTAFRDTADLDRDGNRSEPRWVVLRTRVPGPNGQSWYHYVVAHPIRAVVTVTGNGGREWQVSCPVDQWTTVDGNCAVNIDVASKNTSYRSVPDTYMVNVDVEWRYYCGWENNTLYQRSSPRPTTTGNDCRQRSFSGGGPTFNRSTEDGTIWSESWVDPTDPSENNGQQGRGNYRIPLRVNEIQSTNRDN